MFVSQQTATRFILLKNSVGSLHHLIFIILHMSVHTIYTVYVYMYE